MKTYSIPANARSLKDLAGVASKNQARRVLTMVRVSRKGGACIAEATDSFRLARFTWETDADGGDFEALFAADALRSLKVSDICAVEYGEGGAAIITGSGLRIPAEGGEGLIYPNTDAIMWHTGEPMKDSSALMCVNPAYLADACKPVISWNCPVAIRGCVDGPVFVHAVAKVKNGNREIPMQYDALIMPVRGLDSYAPKAWKDAERKAARKEAQEVREAEERRAERKAKRAEAAKEEAEKPEEAPKVSPEQEPAKEEKPAQDSPNEAAKDSPEEGEEAIRRAAEEFGLAIRETSLCLWLAGDTKPHKDALKKAGAKWSAKKGAWYFRKPQAA